MWEGFSYHKRWYATCTTIVLNIFKTAYMTAIEQKNCLIESMQQKILFPQKYAKKHYECVNNKLILNERNWTQIILVSPCVSTTSDMVKWVWIQTSTSRPSMSVIETIKLYQFLLITYLYQLVVRYMYYYYLTYL